MFGRSRIEVILGLIFSTALKIPFNILPGIPCIARFFYFSWRRHGLITPIELQEISCLLHLMVLLFLFLFWWGGVVSFLTWSPVGFFIHTLISTQYNIQSLPREFSFSFSEASSCLVFCLQTLPTLESLTTNFLLLSSDCGVLPEFL